jgi:uncharacterized membrane protein
MLQLPEQRARRLALLALAAFFVLAGVNHFVSTPFYVEIMPPYVPAPLVLVYVSGALEVLGGVGVLVPRLRSLSGFGLVLLLLADFPANLHMALHPESYPDLPAFGLLVRLPFQGLFIAWAFWATRAEPTEARP